MADNGPSYNLAAIVGQGYGVGRAIGDDFSRTRLSHQDKKLRKQLLVDFPQMDTDPQQAADAKVAYEKAMSGSSAARGAARRAVNLGEIHTRNADGSDSVSGGTPAIQSYTDSYGTERKTAAERQAIARATKPDGTIDDVIYQQTMNSYLSHGGGSGAEVQAGNAKLKEQQMYVAKVQLQHASSAARAALDPAHQSQGGNDTAYRQEQLTRAAVYLTTAMQYSPNHIGTAVRVDRDGTKMYIIDSNELDADGNPSVVATIPVGPELIAEIEKMAVDPAAALDAHMAQQVKDADAQQADTAEARKAARASMGEIIKVIAGKYGSKAASVAGGVASAAAGLNDAGMKVIGEVQSLGDGTFGQAVQTKDGRLLQMVMGPTSADPNTNGLRFFAPGPNRDEVSVNMDEASSAAGQQYMQAMQAAQLHLDAEAMAGLSTAVNNAFGLTDPSMQGHQVTPGNPGAADTGMFPLQGDSGGGHGRPGTTFTNDRTSGGPLTQAISTPPVPRMFVAAPMDPYNAKVQGEIEQDRIERERVNTGANYRYTPGDPRRTDNKATPGDRKQAITLGDPRRTDNKATPGDRKQAITLGTANANSKGASFDALIEPLLSSEGGWSNKPADRGGRTRYGISHKANPDINLDTLTEAGAKKLYKERYWNAIGADSLPPAIRGMAFSAAVNVGAPTVKDWLKKAKGDPVAFEQLWKSHYSVLVAADPTQQQFEKGWNNRIADAKMWTGAPPGADTSRVTAGVLAGVASAPY